MYYHFYGYLKIILLTTRIAH